MNDFVLQLAPTGGELRAAIERVLASGWFVLGREGEAFEREFAAFLGVRETIGVANGLEALQLALMAFDIGPGDEVITTPNSAFATTLAILLVGAKPIFVDIDPATYALDAGLAADAVGPRTRALLPVHIYGQAADLDALADLARERQLVLIGDAAHAHGARYRGRDVAAFGDAVAYSFYPTKNLGALGDGGALVCADPERSRRLRRLRNYGQERRYDHVERGLNSRLDELQAAILRVGLRHLGERNGRRRALAARYRERLAGLPLVLPAEKDYGEHVYHQFVVRTPRRDALADHLRERGVETLVHYPVIIPEQPAARDLGYVRGTCPVAERCASEFLSLPIAPELTEQAVDAVCAGVRSFFAGEA